MLKTTNFRSWNRIHKLAQKVMPLVIPCGKTSFPNWVAICFAPGFPGLDFRSKCVRCGSWPHQRVCEVPSPPACWTTQQRGLLSFVCELVESVSWQINTYDGLVGFEGGGKSLSVPKDIPKLSATISLWVAEGLLLSCLLPERFQTHHGLQIVEPLKLLPLRPRGPWLPYHQSGCRRGEALWWSCWRAGHRPRPGRSGKQSVKRMTRGKNRNQRISEGGILVINGIMVVNLTKLLTHSASIARKNAL